MLGYDVNEQVALMMIIPLALTSCDSTMDAHAFLVGASLFLCGRLTYFYFLDFKLDFAYLLGSNLICARSDPVKNGSYCSSLSSFLYFIRPISYNVKNRTQVSCQAR